MYTFMFAVNKKERKKEREKHSFFLLTRDGIVLFSHSLLLQNLVVSTLRRNSLSYKLKFQMVINASVSWQLLST
jgi:hypothetical protein